MALKFKRNTVRVDILDYNLCVLGLSGVGKTTLAYNVCEKLVPDQYVIFNCGREDGIKTLNNAIYLDVPTWSDFEDAIDEIHDEKMESFPDLKVVVIDTIDEVFTLAEKEIIRRSNREGKACKTINAAFGGFGAGLQKTTELVLDTLWKLKDVGVNVFYIGHLKSKSLVDPMSDMEYQTLTSNLSNRYFTAIATKMDVVGICYIDRDIITEKTSRKDMKGKVIEKSKVANEARKICFRSDNYVADSKSRFPDIVSEINLDADEFIKAIEDAIKAQITKSGRSEDDIKKEQEAEAKKREAEIAELEEQHKKEKELQKICGEIKEFVKEAKEDKNKMKTVKKIVEKSKELGYEKPYEIDDIQDARLILALCK